MIDFFTISACTSLTRLWSDSWGEGSKSVKDRTKWIPRLILILIWIGGMLFLFVSILDKSSTLTTRLWTLSINAWDLRWVQRVPGCLCLCFFGLHILSEGFSQLRAQLYGIFILVLSIYFVLPCPQCSFPSLSPFFLPRFFSFFSFSFWFSLNKPKNCLYYL